MGNAAGGSTLRWGHLGPSTPPVAPRRPLGARGRPAADEDRIVLLVRTHMDAGSYLCSDQENILRPGEKVGKCVHMRPRPSLTGARARTTGGHATRARPCSWPE